MEQLTLGSLRELGPQTRRFPEMLCGSWVGAWLGLSLGVSHREQKHVAV